MISKFYYFTNIEISKSVSIQFTYGKTCDILLIEKSGKGDFIYE